MTAAGRLMLASTRISWLTRWQGFRIRNSRDEVVRDQRSNRTLWTSTLLEVQNAVAADNPAGGFSNFSAPATHGYNCNEFEDG